MDFLYGKYHAKYASKEGKAHKNDDDDSKQV